MVLQLQLLLVEVVLPQVLPPQAKKEEEVPDEFLWNTLKMIMNENMTTADICTGSSERSRWLFTLNYQRVPGRNTTLGADSVGGTLNLQKKNLYFVKAVCTQKNYYEWRQNFIELQDSTKRGDKASRIFKKQDIQAEIITVGEDNVMSYVVLFTDRGWNVGVTSARSFVESDSGFLPRLFLADVVMLFYKSDDAAELGGKSIVSAVLEKFMMVGITAVVVGVNTTNVNFIESIYARRSSGLSLIHI